MKDFTLEDMTKPELIKIIKQSLAYQPTQKVMRWVRWESMCEQAQVIMKESIEEQRLHTGEIGTANHLRWVEASKKFDHGMELADLADAFLAEIKG